MYTQTTTRDLWACMNTNTWKKILSTSNTGTFVDTGTTGTSPGTPATGSLSCYYDSTSKTQICIDDAGNASTTVRGTTETTGQFVTHISALGVIAKRALLASDIPSLSATYQPLSTTLTQIGALPCADGQIHKKVAGSWACAADATGAAGTVTDNDLVGNCYFTRTSATVLTMGACTFLYEDVPFTFSGGTVNMGTFSGTTTIKACIATDGSVKIAHDAAGGLFTYTGFGEVPLASSCPAATQSIWQWVATGGAFAASGTNLLYKPQVRDEIASTTGTATLTKSITVFDPVTTDSGRVQLVFGSAVTITRVWCSVKSGTSVSINLDERAEATPDTAGTAVMSTALVCDADSQATTTFANAGIAVRVPLALTISAVSGAVDTLRVHVEYQ
jgi:hypothetical protein